MGLYPIHLYVDDDTAMAAGREVYGFPKKMAHIETGAHELRLVRCGLAPEAAPGPVQPIEVMSAGWSADPQASNLSFALPLLGGSARLMTFYNTHYLTRPGARNDVSSVPNQLTKVALTDIEAHRVSALHDFRLRVNASVNDSVYLLMPADRDAAETRARWGVRVERAFSMGTGRIVGAAARQRPPVAGLLADFSGGRSRCPMPGTALRAR